MFAMPASLDRKTLEAKLESVLVPIEPSEKFIGKLQARLIRLRGTGGFSPWMAVVVLATAVLLLATWLSLTLRMVLALLGLLGVASRRWGKGGEKKTATL